MQRKAGEHHVDGCLAWLGGSSVWRVTFGFMHEIRLRAGTSMLNRTYPSYYSILYIYCTVYFMSIYLYSGI